MTFDEWVVNNVHAITAAHAVSVEDISPDPGILAAQLASARKHFVALGELKADATSWVNKTYAMAVQEARKLDGYTAPERKAMAEADPIYLCALKLQSDVATIMRALDKMHYEILNDRRTGFSPRMHA